MDNLFESLIMDDPNSIDYLLTESDDIDMDDTFEIKERLKKIRNVLFLAAGALALLSFIKNKINDMNKKKLFEKNTRNLAKAISMEKEKLQNNRDKYKEMSKNRKNFNHRERKACKNLAAEIDNQLVYITNMQKKVSRISENYCKANNLNLLNASNELMARYKAKGDERYTRFSVYQSMKDYNSSVKPLKKKRRKKIW